MYRVRNLGRVLSLGLVGVFLAVGVFCPSVAGAQAVATTFRTGEHPGKTRFVLELTKKPEFKIFTLDDPYRIVIDFTGVDWQVPPSLRKRGGGLIERVRNGSSRPGNHRVVLDLAAPALVQKAFLLDPDGGFPWLFVLDLARTSRAAFLANRDGGAPQKMATARAPVQPMTPPPVVPPALRPEEIADDITPPAPAIPTPVFPPLELSLEDGPEPQAEAPPSGDIFDTQAAPVSAAPVAAQVPERPEVPPAPQVERSLEKRDALTYLQRVASFFDISGNVELEGRGFFYDGRTANFGQTDHSLSAEMKFEKYWDNDRQSFTFVPFFRFDDNDHERTHFDIRELRWVGGFGDYEVKVGIDKVFWGVTEAVHLIDIINQTDAVEDFDQEDKLGQFMVNIVYLHDLGTFELYVLPGFRPRTFGSALTRPTNGFRISTEHEKYESGARDRHVDYAARWSQTFDEWDVGLSHFYGTSRDPRFRLELDSMGPVLTPYYDQIHQSSLGVQWTHEAWLLKFEGLRRSGQGKTYYAAAGGFEYTFFGVLDSAADIGIVGEYLFDNRHDSAPTPFENDVFIGGRWTANDIQDMNILAGVIFDLDSYGRVASIEASRRLGSNWKLSLDIRLFDSIPAKAPLYPLRSDDHIQLRLARFF
ncbi:MAG: AMIN domain-containing protein [Rhodospirillales bacterium]|nr:AMIN domain-containing protein [Rhodospirillales bacterium]